MKATTLPHPTTCEQAYDDALTAYNDFPSEDTAQYLWVAELALKRERKQARISYDKHEENYKSMIKELNRNLDYGQGRRMESHYFSDKAAVICLLAMGAVWFIAWLMR